MSGKDRLAEFGARLTAAREERGLSQKQLAAKLRINVSTLSRHERGEASPRFDELLALRAALGVSLDFLMTGEGPPGQPTLSSHDPRFDRVQEALALLPRDLREVLARFVLEQQPAQAACDPVNPSHPERCG